LIGNFTQPQPYLPVHVMQIGELTQRPEALPDITDGALNFAFGESRGMHRILTAHKDVFA
jgi:hypothetical protein